MRLGSLLVILLAGLLTAGCTTGFFSDRVSQPGDAAKDLVDPRRYAKLLVEIDYPVGYAPHDEALSHLKNTLVAVTTRSAENVQISLDASIPVEKGKKYSWGEIEALERAHRNRHSSGDTVVLYMVYVAGGSQEDTDQGSVLGAAYRGTSLVMFKENLNKAGESTLLNPRAPVRCVERAVIVHEFGHAAGLVDLGTPMVRNHADPESPGHSSNRKSVMFHAVENSGSLFNLLGSNCSDIPHQFDADDLADLKALRES